MRNYFFFPPPFLQKPKFRYMPLFIIKLWRKRWIKTFVAIIGSIIIYFVMNTIHNSQITDDQYRERLEARGSVAY